MLVIFSKPLYFAKLPELPHASSDFVGDITKVKQLPVLPKLYSIVSTASITSAVALASLIFILELETLPSLLRRRSLRAPKVVVVVIPLRRTSRSLKSAKLGSGDFFLWT